MIGRFWKRLTPFRRLSCVNNKSRRYYVLTSQKYLYFYEPIQSQLIHSQNNDVRREFYGISGNEEDQILQSIVKASSAQQVFDIDCTTVRHCSQALVTLWDNQKLMFHTTTLNNSKFEYSSHQDYISAIRNLPKFQSIVNHLVEKCEQLEDIDLTVSLMYMKKFGFKVRHPKCQLLISELSRRKRTLSLGALTNLCIILRDLSNYGTFVLLEFLPILSKYIDEMSSDQDVKLITACLASSIHGLPPSLVQKYREKLNNIYEANDIEFESRTLCEILVFLKTTEFIVSGTFTSFSTSLVNKSAYKLAPLVDKMDLQDCIVLSSIMDYQYPFPHDVVGKVLKRFSQHLEIASNLDLLASVRPTTVKEHTKLEEYVNDVMDNCNDFLSVANNIFRILKKIECNFETRDKFWTKVTDLITNTLAYDDHVSTDDSYFVNSVNMKLPNEFGDDSVDTDDGHTHQEILLRWSTLYTHVRLRKLKPYQHLNFEEAATREILMCLPDVVSPRVYADCISFLIATNYKIVNLSPTFLQNFRFKELSKIALAMHTSRSRLRWATIAKQLSERGQDILSNIGEDHHPREYVSMAKIEVDFQRNFMSPVFVDCFRKAVDSNWMQPRGAHEVLKLMIVADGFYYPPAFEIISNYIQDHEYEVDDRLAALFVRAGYVCGIDYLAGCTTAARVIERNFSGNSPRKSVLDMLGLLYHGCLHKDLINKVFSLDFLSLLDEQLKPNCCGLESNVPWFHEMYCEEVAATSGVDNSYLHEEVANVLGEILRGPKNVARNIYSPYYYLIDFLVQLDHRGNPIKSTKRLNKGATGKNIAVLIQKPKDYTANLRQLKGDHLMKKKHLEILGYQVCNIDPYLWNTMQMSEPNAKKDYLKRVIFGK